MAIRTLEEIIQSAIDFIAGKRPNIATYVGTVTRDVVIEAPAQEFEKVYEELESTRQLQSLVYAEEMTEEQLDDLASNYGMSRLAGRAASGTVVFQIRNFSTSSSDVTVPVGTTVSTLASETIQQVSFVTTEEVIFLASEAPSYFNPTTGLYERIATIVAEQEGSGGNVAAGTIVQLVTSTPGIDSVNNTVATTGGQDKESNTDFAERIRQKLSGNSVGTTAGINSLMRENVNTQDSIVVTPNDPEMIRDEFGGEVDVYILGEILTTTFDIRQYLLTASQEFIMQHQPVRSVSSVTGIVSAAPYTFVEGVDYDVEFDPSTIYNGSVRLETKIVFRLGMGGATMPDDGTNITINYVYNSLIEELQTELDKDENNIVTSDILVKEAEKAEIDVTADVTLYPGYNEADAISDIQTAVSEEIDALGLGDSIDRSDIVAAIESVESVDAVDLSTLILAKNGTPIPSNVQRLTIAKTEYPRARNININSI